MAAATPAVKVYNEVLVFSGTVLFTFIIYSCRLLCFTLDFKQRFRLKVTIRDKPKFPIADGFEEWMFLVIEMSVLWGLELKKECKKTFMFFVQNIKVSRSYTVYKKSGSLFSFYLFEVVQSNGSWRVEYKYIHLQLQ